MFKLLLSITQSMVWANQGLLYMREYNYSSDVNSLTYLYYYLVVSKTSNKKVL